MATSLKGHGTATGLSLPDLLQKPSGWLQSARVVQSQLPRNRPVAMKPARPTTHSLASHPARPTRPAVTTAAFSNASSSTGISLHGTLLKLLHPKTPPNPTDKIMVFLPGTDGTGQAILPQLSYLHAAGYDVYCLYMPPRDRSTWAQLTASCTQLITQLLEQQGRSVKQVTLMGESFGGILALRLAAAAPHLINKAVLLNPATSFSRSLGGLSSLVSSTNLLSLFPPALYQVSQAALLPLLVDSARLSSKGAHLMRAMIDMLPVDEVLQEKTAAAANWRAGLMREGSDIPVTVLRSITVPVVLLISAKDRMLPSLTEGARLRQLLPNVQKLILPDSGHAAMLERSINIVNLIKQAEMNSATVKKQPVKTRGGGVSGGRAANGVARSSSTAGASTAPSPTTMAASSSGTNTSNGNGSSYVISSNGNGNGSSNGNGVGSVGRASPGTTSGFNKNNGNTINSSIPTALPTTNKSAVVPGQATGTIAAVSSTVWGRPEGGGVGGDGGAVTAGASGSNLNSTAGGGSGVVMTALGGGGDVAGVGKTAGGQAGGAAAGGAVDSASRPGATAGAASGAGAGVGAGLQGLNTFPSFSLPDPVASLSDQVGRLMSSGAAAMSGAAAAAGGGGAAGRGSEAGAEEDTIDSFDEWQQILAPWRDLVSPVVLGMEHLPDPTSPEAARPMLFVGNHQRVGFYDTPLLVYELSIRGYRVRGLAHPGHWSGPVGPFFEKFGAVKASPMAAFRLLKAEEKVLLFPGGAKEVSKPKNADYTLFWKDEPDFVRMAAKCNALIVPFAAVGADDAYEVLMDASEIIAHPVLGPVARRIYDWWQPGDISIEQAILPITKLPGLGVPSLLPIPNLNRIYFKFEQPIDTASLNLNLSDKQAVQDLYGQVKTRIEQSMAELLEYRAQDQGAQVGGRINRAMSDYTAMVTSVSPLTLGGGSDKPRSPQEDEE